MEHKRIDSSSRGLKLSQIILIIIFIPVMIVFLLSVSIGYSIEKKELIMAISELNAVHAKEKETAIESLFHSMEASLEELAAQLSAVPLTDKDTESYVHLLLKLNNYFDYSYIVNDKGIVVQSFLKPSSSAKSNTVYKGLKLNQPLVARPYQFPTESPIMTLSQPIYDKNGEYKGFITGSFNLEDNNAFHDILKSEVSSVTHSYSYVVDVEKRLLYHPNRSRFLDIEEDNHVVDQVITGHEGSAVVENSQGQKFVAGYAFVEDLDWGIVTQTPLSYINERANHLTRRMLYVSLPCFVMLFLASIWIATRLTLPIKQLMAFLISYLSKDGKVQDLTSIRSRWNYETNELTKLLTTMVREVEQENHKLLKESVTDPLTGLMNRRDIDLSQRIHGPYAVVLIDIDHFKSINDTFGHLKGDEAIVQLAQVIQQIKRRDDICCRYGGEEFLLLLPSTTEREAYLFTEKIRIAIEKYELSFNYQVTMSAGISHITSGAVPLELLVAAADEALYDAKSNGRNRVIIGEEVHARTS